MTKIDDIGDYISKHPGPIGLFLEEMKIFVNTTLSGAKEGMRYGAPVFFNQKGLAVIYLFGARDHANFGFLKSPALQVPEGFLEGSGKPSKHVKIYPEKPIHRKTLRALMRQCEMLE